MEKKAVSGIMLTLFIISMLTFAFNIQPVRSDWSWTGTIYIRADGSVEPSDAPISTVDNVTYTLTDNIIGNVSWGTNVIVVERNNIVIDGADFTLRGNGDGTGIELSGRSNVTIKNMVIVAFECGIYFWNSSYNSIFGNNITNNDCGITLTSSSYNNISGNNITNNGDGVYLFESTNNTISRNNFVGGCLFVWGSYGNVVVDNLVNGKPLVYLENVSDMAIEEAGQVILINCNRIKVENLNLSYTTVGVELWNTNNTIIIGNNITNNGDGVHFELSNYNIISGNNITNNNYGVYNILNSSNNIVSRNNITDNSNHGVSISGFFSRNNIVSGNNIANNGGSGVYLGSPSGNDTIIGNNIVNNSWYGVSLYGSNHNIVSENNIINNSYGVYPYKSSNNTILRNNIMNKHIGVCLGSSSSNNTIIGNNIVNNSWYGVYLHENSNNMFYHNNFINNTQQVSILGSYNNVWDNGYPSGGNHWSDYTGADLYSGPYQNITGNDGIGDTPYVINAGNVDHYQLMKPYGSLYDITIKAHCNAEGVDASISITMDGSPTGYTTPYTFTNLTETHTFTVPDNDLNGHPFKQWSRGETSTTIAVAFGGTYTAYYDIMYNLTITTTTGGTTNPTPGTHTYWSGTIVSVTAIPDTGYGLDHWELDDVDVGSANPYTVLIHKNHTLTAVFSPVPDVAIVSVLPSATEVYVGQVVNITVVVKNEGTTAETFPVTCKYTLEEVEHTIATQTVNDLAPNTTTTSTFTWKTTDITVHTLKAEIPPLPNEIDTEDNTMTGSMTVKVKILGDVNGDNKVNIKDLAEAAKSFGSYPSHPRWNPQIDINQDGKVDIRDLVLITKNFGKTYS